jgi:hypothetical protein
MNEPAAGQVLLLRAFETTDYTRWTDEDRAWASRSALQAVGTEATDEAFLTARAQAGLRRLEPLDPLLPRWRALRPWRGGWAWLAVGVGLLLGVAFDRIGSAQTINLLAPPVWALIAWNLAVYAILLLRGLLGSAAPGLLCQLLGTLWQRWRARSLQPAGDSAAAWTQFAGDWAACSQPLYGARFAALLHLAAAAVGLGLMAGLYLRGLVLDYRVGWQSTFLDAATVHAWLSTLLAPALALSGQTLPDVAALQALRLPQAGTAVPASAAPWIHLYALQLLLLVLMPRLLLALWAGLRARSLQANLPLPLGEPYFQRLLRQQRGGPTPVRVWPHARAPDPAAQAALRSLLARVLGEGVQLQLAPTVAYGSEEAPAELRSEGAWRVALFDMTATPEPESQGRLLQALGAAGAQPPLALVDESAFVQRFGAGSPRRAERRQAWAELARASGSTAVFIELLSGHPAAAEDALARALQVTRDA